MTPQRIQLQRTKGWRMPANTVKVDRTTKWGNPFTVKGAREAGYRGEAELVWMCMRAFRAWLNGDRDYHGDHVDRRDAIRAGLHAGELRGKNLACWCKPGAPCHADVLLELANR